MLEFESHHARMDLYELGFMFAIQTIDPRVGKVKAESNEWEADGKRNPVEIDLVDCQELI